MEAIVFVNFENKSMRIPLGSKLPVKLTKKASSKYVLGEIIGKCNYFEEPLFYVHFIGFDSKLDEWLGKERLNLTQVQRRLRRSTPGLITARVPLQNSVQKTNLTAGQQMKNKPVQEQEMKKKPVQDQDLKKKSVQEQELKKKSVQKQELKETPIQKQELKKKKFQKKELEKKSVQKQEPKKKPAKEQPKKNTKSSEEKKAVIQVKRPCSSAPKNPTTKKPKVQK